MNLTSLNRRLKFSWSHIIAFVALIAVSYFTFMGAAYYTGGNFIVAATALAIVDFVLILVFIGAQQLKGSGVKMRRKIIWERILVISSPFIFFAAMTFGMYFWNIHGSQHGIIGEFNSALSNAGGMFNDYENYADRRIEQYESRLDSIQLMHSDDPYAKCHCVLIPLEHLNMSSGHLVALQAMSLGKPVICTDADGIRDYVEAGKTGFLVPNKREAWLSALEYLKDRNFYNKMSDVARKAYDTRFSEAVMYGRISELING